MSGIDNVISFFRLLNVTPITSIIDGKVWRYNRPINSDKVDIVISMPEYIGGSFNRASIEINIHSPNMNIKNDGADDYTHPAVSKLQEVNDAVLTILDNYNFTVRGKIIRDNDGHWYSNNIIQIEEIDANLGVDANIIELIGTDDGYGGNTVSQTPYWSGNIAITDIDKGSQLTTNSMTYRFNQRNDFIAPMIVQKNMIISTSEGKYTVLGIIPEGLGFWRINAVRYDSKRS